MRKRTLAITAFTISSVAAMSSSFLPGDVYVKARLNANGPVVCVNTYTQCEPNGLTICRVKITTTRPGIGETSIACSNCAFKTYADSDCIRLSFDSGNTHSSDVQVYELIQK